MNDEDAMKMIVDKQRGLISDENVFSTYTLISSWANHYNSWVKTNHFRRLVVRYEDLISNSYETFRDIIVFTNTLINRTEGVNKDKLIKAIKSTDFNILKNKEIKDGLDKSVTSFKKWRKIHKENKN